MSLLIGLPRDIFIAVLKLLAVQDLCLLSSVSKYWNECSNIKYNRSDSQARNPLIWELKSREMAYTKVSDPTLSAYNLVRNYYMVSRLKTYRSLSKFLKSQPSPDNIFQ